MKFETKNRSFIFYLLIPVPSWFVAALALDSLIQIEISSIWVIFALSIKLVWFLVDSADTTTLTFFNRLIIFLNHFLLGCKGLDVDFVLALRCLLCYFHSFFFLCNNQVKWIFHLSILNIIYFFRIIKNLCCVIIFI